jgi:PAS domain S-box-containing protein
MPVRECLDMLCNTGDGAFIVDADRRIIRWNKEAERILGYSEGDVLNHKCYQVISGRELPDKVFCGPSCKVHSSVIKGENPKSFDMRTQTSNGAPLWLNITVLSHLNIGKAFIAHIFRDVTREKTSSLALERFLAELPLCGAKSGDRTAALTAVKHAAFEKSAAALSAREVEVLTLLAEGFSTKLLAQRLNISHFTARNHIQNILVKLDLHSKAQAVSYAYKTGIL